MRIVTAVFLSLVFSIHARAASIEEDVQRYVAVFSGDRSEHAANALALSWMGLSDTRVFDTIEQRLLRDYPVPNGDKREKQRLAWYIRALGFSGEAKYLPTMDKFLADRDYAVYARQAAKDSPEYRKWNPVISSRASFDPALGDDANRTANMLRSGDFMLKRLGAKRVYFAPHDEDVLLDMLARDIRAGYLEADESNGDAIAWMVRALANSKKEKYQPLIQEVATNAKLPKLRVWATNSLKSFKKT